MSQSTAPRLRFHVHRTSRPTAPRPDFALDGVLDADIVESFMREDQVGWRHVTYTPLLTFWAFFWQMLSPDKSCRAALKRIAAREAASGATIDAEDTGPYCKARARLPESLPHRLMGHVGRAVHGAAPESWRWCGRRVKVVDGSTVSMPDTAANRREYPQIPGQRAGVGFPIARIVVVFCLATGVVLEAALGRYQGKQTGENSLFRGTWDELERDDVVLGDRYYGSYFDLAMLKRRGVDCAFRLHQRRHSDFRRGRRLGRDDHVVTWRRPDRPDWMDRATYEQIPEEMEVRELRVRVAQRGFRTRGFVVVTTLLDANLYKKDDICTLYRQRWHAELDLRTIKVVLGMDVLRCKTPAMVRKEIWMTLLGYNAIRAVMAQAAEAHGEAPRRLSTKGALQSVLAFAEGLRQARGERRRWLWDVMRWGIAADGVGGRPDRYEPRAWKRRPKPHKLLMEPRKEARKRLLKAG
jgi:hypothetical protein